MAGRAASPKNRRASAGSQRATTTAVCRANEASSGSTLSSAEDSRMTTTRSAPLAAVTSTRASRFA